jgi:nicotinamidase-related amidase
MIVGSRQDNTSKRWPTLLLIDVQRGFDEPQWGRRNNPLAERRIADLLSAWREESGNIVHIRHRSSSKDGVFQPSSDNFQFKPEAQPHAKELVLTKSANSAFIGTELETFLREDGAEAVVIVGFTTDHCCSSTARMAANLGFETTVVADATATFPRQARSGRWITAEAVHEVELAILAAEFAETPDTRQLLARWAQSTQSTGD